MSAARMPARMSRLTIIPPIAAGAARRPPLARLAFPLGDRHCHPAADCAVALRSGAGDLGLASGDEVLVPAHCAAAALLALRDAGLVARVYGGALPAPDEDELEALLTPAVRALYIVHQLGFAQDAERWRAWCDERRLRLVEDATHALAATAAGRPVGSLADLAVFGLAECLGLPGGAMLRQPSAPPVPAGVENTLATTLATRLLWRLGDEHVAARRRARYAELLEQLGERVPDPFAVLPAGAAPFALPLRVSSGDGLRERLADRGVETSTTWPAPPGTVLVPAHQELRARDVRRIVEACAGPRPRREREELELEPLAGFDALADDWSRLAVATGTPFATAQWLQTWWLHNAGSDTMSLYACRDRRGRVAAILPLTLRSAGPLTVMRFAGHGPSDELGPICAAADRPAVARALLRAADDAGADALLGEQLPADAGWDALLGARVLGTEGNPVSHFTAGGWDAQLRRWTPSVRRQLNRHTRKLERDHEVRIRVTQSSAELAHDLDLLFALHEARWSPGESAFATRDAALHRDFAAVALAQGWLALSFLEVDGEAVAAVYNLRYAGHEHQYQQGRLAAWDAYSVGSIALLRSMRDACEAGMRAFRFLRGDERYKYVYADADPGLQTIAIARGRSAAGALAVASAVPRSLLKPARRWVAAA